MPAWFCILLILILLGAASAADKKLTWPAAATGVLLGFLIYKGSTYTGLFLLATFFVLGTGATSWGYRKKQGLGIAEARGGRRTAGQVWANAGVAALTSAAAIFFPEKAPMFHLMVGGSFSAAAADTLSSELGNVYGKRFYNMLTFKKDQRGLNGVISLEGTLCGIAGSVLIAVVYSSGFGWDHHFIWIVIAGTIGNLADSILGATVERKGWLGNNAVNFLNTLVGAIVASLLL